NNDLDDKRLSLRHAKHLFVIDEQMRRHDLNVRLALLDDAPQRFAMPTKVHWLNDASVNGALPIVSNPAPLDELEIRPDLISRLADLYLERLGTARAHRLDHDGDGTWLLV